MNYSPGNIYVRVRRGSQSVSIAILLKKTGSTVHVAPSNLGTKRDLILFGLEFVRLAVLEFVRFNASMFERKAKPDEFEYGSELMRSRVNGA
jgi:hypothetical protein